MREKVQENDRIRSLKPNFDRVIWSQVTIDDLPIFFDKPLLQLDPLIARCRIKAWPPEHLVQLYHGQPSDLAQMNRKRRFA
jgi:hypothetical protein